MKADMDRLGLAFALSIADQCKQYDQIPDWLRPSSDTQVDFNQRLIAAYPELERTSNSGSKQYWCPVTKRWFALGYMRDWFLTTEDIIKSDVFLASQITDIITFGAPEMASIFALLWKWPLIKAI